jgi:hypothetical protein
MIPSQLAAAFQRLTAVVVDGCSSKEGYTREEGLSSESDILCLSLEKVETILDLTVELLNEDDKGLEVFKKVMDDLGTAQQELFKLFENEKNYRDTAWDTVGPLSTMRKILARVHVIKQTSFSSEGYALMDSMLVAIFALLTVTQWDVSTQRATAIAFTIVLSTLFTYLSLLVRSLENPFNFPPNFCLQHVQSRRSRMTIVEGFWYGKPIDMSPLQVFVSQLNENLRIARARSVATQHNEITDEDGRSGAVVTMSNPPVERIVYVPTDKYLDHKIEVCETDYSIREWGTSLLKGKGVF